MVHRARSGVTLVELLVVIGIIAILLAILIPAIQYVRESGNRASCQNNLRQLGLATMHYADVHETMPYYVGWKGKSVFVTLLPQLEQKALGDRLERFETLPRAVGSTSHDPLRIGPLPIVRCPSAEWQSALSGSYLANAGTRWTGQYDGAFSDPEYGPVRPAEFSDGLTQTALFGEAGYHSGPPIASVGRFDLPAERGVMLRHCHEAEPHMTPLYTVLSVWWDGSFCRYNHAAAPNSTGCKVANGNLGHTTLPCSSQHHGGANIVFCDGRVAFTSDTVDTDIWYAAGTRAGGEISKL